MSHFRVALDCWRRTKRYGRYAQRTTKTFIVEAADHEDAFKVAREHCALSRADGWLAIEDRECSAEKLPLCVVTWHHKGVIKLASELTVPTGVRECD